MLREWLIVSETLLDKLDEFRVILNAVGNNHALCRSDVVHNELLEHSCVDLSDVALSAHQRHAHRVVSVSGLQQQLWILHKGIKFVEVSV